MGGKDSGHRQQRCREEVHRICKAISNRAAQPRKHDRHQAGAVGLVLPHLEQADHQRDHQRPPAQTDQPSKDSRQ